MKGLLLRALAKGEVLEMIYLDNKGNISQRKIKVLSLSEESFWAYCYARKQQRIFNLNNLLSIGPERKVKRGA